MEIDYLAQHPQFIPILAEWTYQEWRHLRPGDSVDRRIERLKQESSARGGRAIPTVVVAYDGDNLLGAAKLVLNDMDTRPELSPWLAGVFVGPLFRGRGIGAALVRRVMEEARTLGLARLYLYTPSAAPFYAKLNWSFFERSLYRDMEVTIMTYDFPSNSVTGK